MKSHTLPSIQENDHVPIDQQTSRQASGKSRKTILVVITLIITGFLILKLWQSETHASAAASEAVIEKKNTPVKTTAEIKEERRKKEIASPANYIKTKIKWRKNLVGETVLDGTLTNMATLADFKDPVITISWLSKTNTILATTNHPLYEYLGAKKTIPYKLKLKAPAKYASIKASVESATAL
jgi:hypothetical protein